MLERSGVSAATLYRGWPSKEALVAAALERRQCDWLATWDRAVDRAADDRGRVLAVFDALDEYRSGTGRIALVRVPRDGLGVRRRAS